MRVPTDLWNQFGGNPAGSGFRLVNSMRASELEWIVGLPGPTGTSSAVFGPGGTIYIGTTNGHLLAVQPEPPHHVTVRWDIQLPGFNVAVQTPAVADDGTIYCLCSAPGGTVRDHRTIRGSNSFVVAVDPNGTIRWQGTDPNAPRPARRRQLRHQQRAPSHLRGERHRAGHFCGALHARCPIPGAGPRGPRSVVCVRAGDR